jgi:hypothetical protein
MEQGGGWGQAQAEESMLRSKLVLGRLTRCVDKWHWSALSSSSAIDMSHVLAFPDKPWSCYWLSFNPNFTLDHVLALPDKPWVLEHAEQPPQRHARPRAGPPRQAVVLGRDQQAAWNP